MDGIFQGTAPSGLNFGALEFCSGNVLKVLEPPEVHMDRSVVQCTRLIRRHVPSKLPIGFKSQMMNGTLFKTEEISI